MLEKENVIKVKKILFEKQSLYYTNDNSEEINIKYTEINSLNAKLFVEYCSAPYGGALNHSLFICITLKQGNTMSLKYYDYDITHSAANFPVLFNIIDNSSNIPNFSYEIECFPQRYMSYFCDT